MTNHGLPSVEYKCPQGIRWVFSCLVALLIQHIYIPNACGADWPMRGGNIQRTGYVPDSTMKPPFVVKWSYYRGEGSGSWVVSPVIANGVLYQGDRLLGGPEYLWALDAQTGAFLWKHLTAPMEIIDMTYDGGALYYGMQDGILPGIKQWLQKFDINTRSVVWTRSMTYTVLNSFSSGMNYAINSTGTLYAIPGDSGTVAWEYPFLMKNTTSSSQNFGFSALRNGILFVPEQPCVAIYDRGGTYEVKWRSLLQPMDASRDVVISNGAVYARRKTMFFALEEETGSLRWSESLSGDGSISAAGSIIYLSDDHGAGGYVRAYQDNGTSCTLLWKTEINYDNLGVGKPLIMGDYVYINSTGAIIALNRATGATVWDYNTGFALSSPVSANNLLYFGPGKNVFCFGKPLNLALDVDRKTAVPGDDVVYTLTINSYNGPAANITLVATLPAEMIYQSSSDGGILVGSRLVVWNGLPVSANVIKHVTINSRIDAGLPAGSHDLVAQGFLEYVGSPDDPALTECLSDYAHTIVSVSTPPEPIPPSEINSGPLRVYPNPFRRQKAVRGTLKFEGVKIGTRVEIFDNSGNTVWKSSPASGTLIEWDGKNDTGKSVAPGLYLYLLNSGAGKTRGKIIVE